MSSEALATPEVCGSGTGCQPVRHGQDLPACSAQAGAHATRSLTEASSEFAIQAAGLGKCYQIYAKPRDRLLQMLARGRKQYYREFWALRDLTFAVRRGETVGIIGRNGSGKSTLLQLVCGVLAQTEGTVHTQGRIAALLELGAGFNPEFTGRENVYLSAAIMGLTPPEVDARFAEIAAFADIGDFMAQPVKTYSSGMYVRLAFAVAIAVNPDILVIDEALAVGDIAFQQKCYRRLRDLQGLGTTILLVSHDLSSIVTYCQKTLLLDNGIAIGPGDTKTITELYRKTMTTHLSREGSSSDSASERPANGWRGGERLCDSFTRNRNCTEYGGQTAQIIDWGLLDADGQARDTFGDDEVTGIRVQVHFRTACEQPIIGFFIRSLKGVEITGTNTTYANREIGPCVPDDIITVTFSQLLALRPGHYSLCLGCSEYRHDGLITHHRLYDVLLFEIMGRNACVGLVNPHSTVNLERTKR